MRRRVVFGGIAVVAALAAAWLVVRSSREDPEPAERDRVAAAPFEPPSLATNDKKSGRPGWLARLLGFGGPRESKSDEESTDESRLALHENPDPTGGTKTVDGIVVDERGKPVAGASVWTTQMVTLTGPDLVGRTGADGRFRVESSSGWTLVTATAPGLVSRSSVRVQDSDRPPGEPLRVVVWPATEAVVRVTWRGSRQPVAHASVEVAGNSSSFNWIAFTDETGTARTPVPVVPGQWVTARAEPGRFGPRFSAGESAERQGEDGSVAIEVVVGKGGRIQGRVVDAHDVPVARAEVSLSTRESTTVTRADASGQFDFGLSELLPRTVGERAALSATGPKGDTRASERVELPTDGQAATVTLRLEPVARLTGRVVDLQGKPLAGLRIVALDWGGGVPYPEPLAVTDGQGRFECNSMPPPDSLRVDTAEGVELRRLHRLPAPPVLIVVDAHVGSTAHLDVEVVSSDGEPVEGVRVAADDQTENTDARGRAALSGLPRAQVAVYVTPREGCQVARAVDLRRPQAEPERFRLGSGVIAGRVVRPDGSPAWAFVVLSAVVSWKDDATGQSVEDPGVMGRRIETDPQGGFRITGVADGEYRVWYGEVGASSGPNHPERVRPGVEDLRLVLPASTEAGRIEVEVSGEPLPAPRVVAEDDFVWIAEDGIDVRLEVPRAAPIDVSLLPVRGAPSVFVSQLPPFGEAVPPGEYDVTVYPGAGALPVRLGRQRVGDGPVRWKVVRSRGAVVEGRVVDGEGRPVPDARVEAGPVGWTHARSRTGGHAFGETDTEGRFTLAGLADGEVEVVVRAGEDGGPVVETSKKTTVSAERPTRLDLVVAVGGSVEVWLANEARLTTGFRLTLTAKEGGLVRTIEKTARQVADERRGEGDHSYPWSFEGVALGKHVVDVVWDGVELPPSEIEVRARETSLLTLPPR